MFLVRRNVTASPYTELRRELDNLFEGFLGRESRGFARGARPYPAINVWEDGEKLYAEAEVPGLGLDDVEILIHGNELTLKGLRRPAEGDHSVYHRHERGTGEFSRHLTLPTDVDADRVEAALKDGVLMIVMPKSEKARARKITVKTA